eukprot:scaffold44815_cov24-Attheya_sp.AAC.1
MEGPTIWTKIPSFPSMTNWNVKTRHWHKNLPSFAKTFTVSRYNWPTRLPTPRNVPWKKSRRTHESVLWIVLWIDPNIKRAFSKGWIGFWAR